jgi:hypothetical protein
MLEEINSHERDGKKEGIYISVTALLKDMCPTEKPTEYMIEYMKEGTLLHRDIEHFYNNDNDKKKKEKKKIEIKEKEKEKEKENTSIEFGQFKEFVQYANDVLEIEPYRTEWNVYDEEREHE